MCMHWVSINIVIYIYSEFHLADMQFTFCTQFLNLSKWYLNRALTIQRKYLPRMTGVREHFQRYLYLPWPHMTTKREYFQMYLYLQWSLWRLCENFFRVIFIYHDLVYDGCEGTFSEVFLFTMTKIWRIYANIFSMEINAIHSEQCENGTVNLKDSIGSQ